MTDEEKVEVGECDVCHAEDVLLKEYGRYSEEELADKPQHFYSQRKMMECEVCAGSLIGVVVRYHKPNMDLFQALGFCTNLILKAIKENRK